MKFSEFMKRCKHRKTRSCRETSSGCRYYDYCKLSDDKCTEANCKKMKEKGA